MSHGLRNRALRKQCCSGWHKVREPTNQVHQQRRISSIAKTPSIRCFVENCICCDLRAFSGVIFPSFDGNSNMFATFTEQKSYRQNRKAIDRTENLSKDQKSYRWNRKAIDRSEWLSIEQNSYRQIRMAIDRSEWLSIEGNSYRERRIAIIIE